uniref:RRM domain-containing protein n=1 Tax=Globodera pallida TaxID=36090 RepID=A0A183C4W2_GLOPA
MAAVNVLHVGGLRVRNGKRVGLKEVVFAFNHAAQPADTPDSVQVLDIFYPRDCGYALIQMCSNEAAKRAQERLHKSWIFEKFIGVDFGLKPKYPHFISNRTQPSPLVANLFVSPNSTETIESAEDEAESSLTSKPQLQEIFIVKMPMGVTRHFRPGTYEPDGKNNLLISNNREEDEDEREVLVITGLETSWGRALTRFDLIQLFSCYGDVIDCGVFLRRRIPTALDGTPVPPPRPFALVQLNNAEQATRAMNSLDYTWQMGRFIKVTYARERSILVTNSSIKLKYRSKILPKE